MSVGWRRELLYAAVAFVEATWVFAWVQALRVPGVPVPGWGWFALYAFGLVKINRALLAGRPHWPQRRVQLVGLVVALLGMGAVQWLSTWWATSDLLGSARLVGRTASSLLRGRFDGGSVVLLGLTVLWFRAIHITQQPIRFHFTAYRFRLGVLLLSGAFLAAVARRQPLSVVVVPLYFGAGLLAMALARAEQAQADLDAGAPPFDRRWVAALLGSLAAILLVGWTLTTLLSPDMLARVASFGAPVVEGIRLLVYSIALVVAWPFLMLAEWMVRHLPVEAIPIPTVIPSAETIPDSEATTAPSWARFSLHVMRLVGPPLLLVVLVVLIALSLRRTSDRPLWLPEEERLPADRQSHKPYKERRFRWMRRLRRASRQAFLPPENVRAIYHNLLVWGSRQGVERLSGETPHEYLRRLQQRAPELAPALEAITAAYVAARYGAISVPAGELQRLRRVWESIHGGGPVEPSAH